MTPEQKQEAFNNATILVSMAFPRHDSTVAQLYLMWDQCAVYLQHVVRLKDSFREERSKNGANPKFSALQVYCDLNNACQRYVRSEFFSFFYIIVYFVNHKRIYGNSSFTTGTFWSSTLLRS